MGNAGSSIGPATGNAVAYFSIWWLGTKYGYSFEDPELAVAMGGALVATLILELKRLAAGIVYGFTYIFSKKKEKEE